MEEKEEEHSDLEDMENDQMIPEKST